MCDASYTTESINTIYTALLKMYNIYCTGVLYSECVPSMWANGYICPLFKKVNKMAPENYRGITIVSCLGKRFTKIINIYEFLYISCGRQNNMCKSNRIHPSRSYLSSQDLVWLGKTAKVTLILMLYWPKISIWHCMDWYTNLPDLKLNTMLMKIH